MQCRFLIFIGLVLLLVQCAPTKSTSTVETNYTEDISYLRKEDKAPVVNTDNTNSAVEKLKYADIEPTNDLKAEIDSVIRIIQASREEIEFLSGYTIQVYTGASRDAANEMKEKIYEYSDQYEPEVSYVQPNFRVKVGKFFDRLEANKVYVDLKKEFPTAIVVPERIYFD